MELGIVAQRDNPRAASLAGDIRDAVDADVVVDDATADAVEAAGVPVDEMSTRDLVVSIGGDGTFLFTARGAGATPVMGVNLGEVGFLNVTAPEDAVDAVGRAVEQYERDALPIQDLPRVGATGDDWALPPSLNEVVVMGEQRGHGGGVEIEVRVDGSLYTGGRADGVLVATPTGSTAYNLSEGGPLVHPDTAGLVVTEMCAAEGMPPLVVGPDSEVVVRVDGPESAVVVGDGRRVQTVETPTDVTIRRSETPMRIAGPDLDFFAALGKLD
ncbi:NAD(+)/NADH kinase [Halomarina oriensis]|uniref:NAD kinase n=1 Tax=Halomarina oriensis TaxID=671145 RepID=A0A6B0GH41_9EURY|nr:NAD(+)/NADH kinase [Halomarina oriensis]MWG34176.1 NAD(+) kinase [Halomarina oriensis]